jgi:hypothetical protein
VQGERVLTGTVGMATDTVATLAVDQKRSLNILTRQMQTMEGELLDCSYTVLTLLLH